MMNMTFQRGQLVRYSRPERGEELLTFVVIEDRDDRVLIESQNFPGWRFAPQEVVAKDEIELLVPKFEVRKQLREATLRVGREK